MAITTTRSPAAVSGTRTTERRFFPELEGMRGVAAMGVLVTHVAFSSGMVGFMDKEPNGFFGVMLQQLHVSLPIFFVLSGMLLYRPFALATIAGTRKPEIKPYFWRRALRTLPAYWVLVAVALLTLNREAVHGIWQVVRPVLLLQVYQIDARLVGRGLEQTWTLATEVAFYAALPLLAWALDKFARRTADPGARVRRILWGLSPLVVIGFAYAAYTFLPSMGAYPIQNEWPPKWLGFIAVGMGLAALSAGADVAPRNVPAFYRFVQNKPVWCWVLAASVYLVACVRPIGRPGHADYPSMAGGMTEHFLYTLFGLLLVAPVTVPNPSRFVVAVMSNPVMRFLGRISYGLYLWHIAVIYFWHGSLFEAGGFLELLAITLGGSVVLATASYYLVESPAMRLRERLGKASAKPSVETISP
ncbi:MULTISPECIES: acyltransferase [unclassified Streptomyces]|uniref:acyltransferase family protein n=1 Tax=unclassified Streptomyces TaxID=2593676 RepID=UPI000F45C901|nr:acyltransferase [Streptomyces sp. I6]RNL68263.1 acyltransferase [Streptomyces sp. I6]